MGLSTTRFSVFTPSGLVLIHASHFVRNSLFSGVLSDMKYVQQPSSPTRSFAERLRNSSSARLNETTGHFDGVRPAETISLKNGTFESPLIVLITQASPLAAK